MKYNLIFFLAVLGLLSSCNNGTTYAELLTDENISVNRFLSNQRVVPYQERDSTFQFEVGEDAPYYELEEDGNVYMQVLNAGTPGNRATYDQVIYFRFTRYNLNSYTDDTLPEGEGNNTDLTYGNTSFRYGNLSSTTSYQWGEGLQYPLYYLPIDCQVNLVIKSQLGLYQEISYVYPFLYNIRYFKSQI